MAKSNKSTGGSKSKPSRPSGSTPVQAVAQRAPRRAESGTSYTAAGHTDPTIQQPTLDQELGSSQPVRIQEIVPELTSPYSRLVTYTKMMNDAGVDVSMRAAKTPVLGADFYLEPYDELDINLEIAEFVEDNLNEGMTSPFSNALEDILHFFEDGYSILEKVYELREWTPPGQGRNTKQYTMLKKLGVRPSSTVSKITYDDNGGPLKIEQGAIKGDGTVQQVEIDIPKLMIFTFSRKGGDLTGKSLLRTAYPHWYYKTHFYKIDAIQKERHSLGVPKGMLKPGYTQKDKDVLRNLLRNLRTNEEAYMVLVPNVDVEFAQIHGNLVDALKSAEHHNTMILLNVLAEFLALGISGSSSGSRATGGVQSDTYMKALRFVANYICDVVNMYLIPELVVWNYPTKSFPQLQVRNMGETKDLQMLGSALANLVAQEAITMDTPTEDWVREVFDMPKKQPNAPGQRVPGRENILLQGSATDAIPGIPASAQTQRTGNGSGNGKPPANAISGTSSDTNTGRVSSQTGNIKTSKGAGNVGAPVNAP